MRPIPKHSTTQTGWKLTDTLTLGGLQLSLRLIGKRFCSPAKLPQNAINFLGLQAVENLLDCHQRHPLHCQLGSAGVSSLGLIAELSRSKPRDSGMWIGVEQP